MDLTNYETFLIDYLDGRLSAAGVEEVLVFLENHPDIKEEFEGMRVISFQTETTSFDASFLHKPQFAEVKQHYEPLLVAQLEGEMSISDELILQQGFILYPELTREQRLFAQTKLVPEQSLVFINKEQLRKGNVFVLHRQTILKVAAILLVTSLIGLYWSQLNHNISVPLAQTTIPVTISKSKSTQGNSPIVSPQPSQTPEPSRAQVNNSYSIIQTHQPATIALIDPQHNASIENHTLPETAALTKSKIWLKHAAPAEQPTEHYASLSEFLRDKLASETKQLEQKTKNTLQEMNKTAGVSIQKNASGRITHFEIEALGFAWSQSK